LVLPSLKSPRITVTAAALARLAQCRNLLYNVPVQVKAEKWRVIADAEPEGRKTMGTATYSHLREHLAEVWNEVEDTQEPIIVRRKGHQDLAILPADELASIQETAHLLRSPKNAQRLLEALVRAHNGEGEAMTVADLANRMGLAATHGSDA
jgi:antitoxin YefM